MKVIIDIAGMYYGREVLLEMENPTVRDALSAARLADKADRAAGEDVPQLNYAEDDRNPNFLRSITVDHKVLVESRQTIQRPDVDKRFYPAGEYTFRSDPVATGVRSDGTVGFISVDQAGNPTGKQFIQTWQYYVYDKDGVDISRKASSEVIRKVVPFSVNDPSNKLEDGGQVVFRLVTIFLDSSRRPGIKTTQADGYKTNKSVSAI